jgi:hypothetical protein
MKRPYWFVAAGVIYRYPSYRDMYVASLGLRPQRMWFASGEHNHPVEHLAGQEAFGIGTKKPL